jgi:hypothetical protein
VATVRCTYRYATALPNDVYDLPPALPDPLTEAVQTLLLATAFAHHLFDRLDLGGLLGAIHRTMW